MERKELGMATRLSPALAEFDRQLERAQAKPEGELRERAMDDLQQEWLPILRGMREEALARRRRPRRLRGVGIFFGYD